jgi:F1F0 ATPase subunit 2
MTGNELQRLLAALVFGVILGGGYFGALWWTVRRLPGKQHSGLWLFTSLLVRLAVTVGAFYLLLPWGAGALAAAMAGFLLARYFWLRSKAAGKPAGENKPNKAEG